LLANCDLIGKTSWPGQLTVFTLIFNVKSIIVFYATALTDDW